MKMKFSFVLFLSLVIPHLKGQQRIERFQHIVLRLTFPSFYNNYNKLCCKLYPGGCYTLLDSTGYAYDSLKGRVTITKSDGWIEFEISKVQFVDGGYYRCSVLGTQDHVYRDYYVEVSEVSGHHSQSQPSVTTTIEVPNPSTTVPDPTGAVLSEDHSDSLRVPWSFGLPFTVIVSVSVMILITSVISVIFCRVKAKQSEKYGESLCESLNQDAPETCGIVYTTVDFGAHQKTRGFHTNMRSQKMRVRHPDPTLSTERDEMVEYSTLAIHQ